MIKDLSHYDIYKQLNDEVERDNRSLNKMFGLLPSSTEQQLTDNLKRIIELKDEQLLYKDNIINSYKDLVELLRKELNNR